MTRPAHHALISPPTPRFFQYYALNGQTLLGPELDNAKYPQVKPVDWEAFMKATPLENLAGTYFAVGQNV
jgi:hypothetical protein